MGMGMLEGRRYGWFSRSGGSGTVNRFMGKVNWRVEKGWGRMEIRDGKWMLGQ